MNLHSMASPFFHLGSQVITNGEYAVDFQKSTTPLEKATSTLLLRIKIRVLPRKGPFGVVCFEGRTSLFLNVERHNFNDFLKH